MSNDLCALDENSIWYFVDKPTDGVLIGSKWVYSIKIKSNGTIDSYKVLLVAQGYKQQYKVDYDETFAMEATNNFNEKLVITETGFGKIYRENDTILVYEYVENSNLRSHLHELDLLNMSWEQRLDICIAEARGLLYLHANAIIHCDVKSTNMLLDENFVAKVMHFGLSKI
ncbi:hypothetical protein BC332_23902 [Capsicum chinense]|nr:hypothetical protein BC332_23902 [Capsicum chinense]